MKKVRTVCSFILTITLILSSFSLSFADKKPTYLTDVYGNSNAQAINVCNYLGIVTGNPDGTFLPDISQCQEENLPQ